MEKTLSIIKPDATEKNVIGKIIDRFESAGLKVIAAKLVQLDKAKAGGFYAEHEGKPFYDNLVEYMTSGPVVVQVLYGPNAIAKNRELMGATNPKKQKQEQLEQTLQKSIDANAVHGSDSPESATREISYFFNEDEIFVN